MPEPSVEPLLEAYRAGKPQAADHLFTAFAPVVRGAIARYLALRGLSGTDLAQDLTHEVFVALFRNDGRRLHDFEGRNGCSFAGWLRVIAVRHAIDALRRERRSCSLDDDTPAMTALRRELAAATPDPEAALEASRTAARLRAAVATLPPKDRLLVEVHILRGAPLQAVASTLGVSANAAYVRKSRILDRLRQALKDSA
jgi:RNA polymerase sigma-70 factor (ECF subfamily)